MTDARFPDRWLSDRRLRRLSDAHFRTFVTALIWAVANRTDGVIEREDLALIPNFAANAVREFVDAGLWTPLEQGWLITDFMETQTSRAQLQHLEVERTKERDKKARQRAAGKADAGGSTTANAVVPRDIPRDIPGDVPLDDTGQARTGQARRGEHSDPPNRNTAESPLCPCGRPAPVNGESGLCGWCELKDSKAMAPQEARA